MKELDAAIAAAHEASRVEPPKAAKKPAKKPVKKAAPVVAKPVPVQAAEPASSRRGNRVRLRASGIPLEGSVSGRDIGEIRFKLEPNKTTYVPDEVYEMLKEKFLKPQVEDAPDWNGDVNNPQSRHRRDENQEYVIEFPDEEQ